MYKNGAEGGSDIESKLKVERQWAMWTRGVQNPGFFPSLKKLSVDTAAGSSGNHDTTS